MLRTEPSGFLGFVLMQALEPTPLGSGRNPAPPKNGRMIPQKGLLQLRSWMQPLRLRSETSGKQAASVLIKALENALPAQHVLLSQTNFCRFNCALQAKRPNKHMAWNCAKRPILFTSGTVPVDLRLISFLPGRGSLFSDPSVGPFSGDHRTRENWFH